MELKIDIEAQMNRASPLTKKGFFGNMVGEYRSAFRGRGLEFTTFRAYDSAGDDAIRIDWKASLRSQDTLVRVFEEERDLKVYFILDTSNSMLFSSHDKLKAEYAAELVAGLAFGILHAEDSVGLIMFSDTVKTFIQEQLGDKQFFTITQALTDVRNYSGEKNYEKLVNFIMGSVPAGSILFFVTDFIGLPENYESILEPMNSKFESIGLLVRDPADNELPAEGTAYLLDPFSDEQLEADAPSIRDAYGKEIEAFRDRLVTTFKKTQDDIVEIMTDEPYMPVVVDYLNKRRSIVLKGGI